MLLPVHNRQTDAEIPVDLNASAAVTLFRAFGSVGKYDHWELEAFALMDAHDADHILTLADDFGLGVGFVRGFHGFHVAQEAVEAAAAHGFELGGFVGDEAQVGDALGAHRQAAAVVVVARAVEDLLHQVLQRHRAADFFPYVDGADHGADLLLEVGVHQA